MTRRQVRAGVLGLLMAVVLAGCTRVTDLSLPGDTQTQTQADTEAGADRPNIVLITTDDQRQSDLDYMPRTRELLADEGVEFTDSLSPHPLCCPARAMWVTGQYAQNNGVRANEGAHGGYHSLVNPENTLPAWLKSAGYRTAFVGKFMNGYQWRQDGVPAGWDGWYPLVEAVYQGYRYGYLDDGEVVRDDGSLHVNDMVTTHTLDMIAEGQSDEAPYFIWASYTAPHNSCRVVDEIRCRFPPEPAKRHKGMFADEANIAEHSSAFDQKDVSGSPTIIRIHPPLGEPDRARLTEMYQRRLESLQSVDEGIARIVQALDAQGELDSTYLVFASDNGYLLGEHRFDGKDLSYEEALRVPLLVRGPDIPQGETIGATVTTVDLAGSLASMAGARPGRTVDGNDLREQIRDPRDNQTVTQLIQGGPSPFGTREWSYRGVRTERFTYIRWTKTGLEELYDRDPDVDPWQVTNVADDAGYAAVRAELARRTDALARCVGTRECTQDFGPVPTVASG